VNRWVTAALVLTLPACASLTRQSCHPGEHRAVQDNLYFGTQRPGGVVSGEEWAQFVKDVITPLFPNGLTLSEASGQWLSVNGLLVRESTRVLHLIHPDDGADDALVRSIVTDYKTRFDQESVLRVKVDACVTF
jgi:hypothetical protein